MKTLGTLLDNPFPGLRPFQVGEEHYFFGRERQTDNMIDKLGETRFLAVIGSSGSGKSSLVSCGLLPALRGGLMPKAGTAWRVASCRPAGQPIRSLARSLAAALAQSNPDVPGNGPIKFEDIVESTLQMCHNGIVDVAELSRLKPSTNLLIIIDQFEELFRYTLELDSDSDNHMGTHSQAAQFIKLLLTAFQQQDIPIYIVLTMRSDFLGDCTRLEGLTEAINQSQYLVPRMTRQQRRIAISGPLGVAGASIDPVLLTRLVNDLGDEPDQLSILQHALNRIWARWSELGRFQDPLTLAHYSAIGSMTLALDQHAEQTFAQLSTDRQKLQCERLFKALTNKATDQRGVRRPTKMSVLCELLDSTKEDVASLIDIFRHPSRSFLMPPVDQQLTMDTVIDIAHESLMRIWKRLNFWADEEAESTHMFQRLANTAKLHANDQAGLWRDPDLQLALEWRMQNQPNAVWASRIGPGFEQAMKFLDDSREANDVERSETIRRAEQQRELERSKAITAEQNERLKAQAIAGRKQRQVTWLVTGGLIVTCALSTAFIWQNLDLRRTSTDLRDYTAALDKKTKDLELQLKERSLVVNSLATRTTDLFQANKWNIQLTQATTGRQRLLTTAMGLLGQGEDVDFNMIHSHRFSNTTDMRLLILKLNPQGYETEPVFLASGEEVTIQGFHNQIWLARALPSGEIHTIGTLNMDDRESQI